MSARGLVRAGTAAGRVVAGRAGGGVRGVVTVAVVALAGLLAAALPAGAQPAGALAVGVAVGAPAPTVNSTTSGSAARVQLGNGTQLVVGGCGPNHCSTVLTTAVIFNPETGTSTSTGSTLTPHASATATLLGSGQVLLAGGCQGRLCGQDNPSSELWSPATGRWTATGSMQPSASYGMTPRDASASLLATGRVLVAGGTNFEAIAQTYNPATGAWTATGPMQAPRESFTLIALASGKVLAAGGCDGYYCQTILRSAELYDPTSGTWTSTGSMRQARYDHSATLLGTGRVRVFGGLNAAQTTATPDEVYTPASGRWAAA